MTNAANPVQALGEFLNVPFPPRNPILGTWLVERSLNMLHASPGAGKSLFSLAISVEVAGGGQFLQWEVPKARRVLYLDAETDPADLQERAQSLKTASSMDEEQLKAVDDNLLIWSKHATAEGGRMPDLKDDTPAAKKELERLCCTHGVDLIIVDNLSTLANIEDENNAGSFSFLDELGNYLKSVVGCAVLFVHHDRKGSNGPESYRGSSKMDALLDIRVALQDKSKTVNGASLQFQLDFQKQRIKVGGDVRPTVAALVDDNSHPRWEDGNPPVDEKLKEFVRRVRTRQYRYGKELAEAYNVRPGTITKWRDRAAESGLMTVEEYNQCLKASPMDNPEAV